jgi:hypothetical protein
MMARTGNWPVKAMQWLQVGELMMSSQRSYDSIFAVLTSMMHWQGCWLVHNHILR